MVPERGLVFEIGLSSAESAGVAEWRHLRLDPGDETTLIEEHGLTEAIAQAMLVDGARPRVAVVDGGLLVVQRGVNCTPGADPEDMVSVRAWLDGTHLLTVSPRRVYAAGDVRDVMAAGERTWTAGDALTAIADQLAERMKPILDEVEEALDDLMEQLHVAEAGGLQRPLGELRHKIAALRRHMAPQRDALKSLARIDTELLSDDNRSQLQHVADRQQRYVEDLDSLRERANVVQDEVNNAVAIALNNNTYLLSIVAAVFLPLGLLTGLLGINVGGMPGTDNPYAFWIVCGLLGVIVVLQVWYLKRRRMI